MRIKKVIILTVVAALGIGIGIWMYIQPRVITIGILIQEDDLMTSSILNGINLATNEWNANSNSNFKVKLVKAQHTSDPNNAKKAFSSMISTYKPSAVLGSFYSSIVIPMISEIQAAKIPFFTGATNPHITQNNKNGYIFRFMTSDSAAIDITMKYFFNVQNKTKFAILYTNSEYGQAANLYAKTASSNLGATLVESIPFSTSDSSINNGIHQINNSDADLCMVWATTSDAPKILSELKNTHFSIPFVGSEGFFPIGEPTNTLPIELNNNYIAADYIPTKINQDWISNVESKYGKDSVNFALAGYYDAANLLYQAISQVGTNFTNLQTKLRSMYYTGIVGTYHFDQNGEGLKQTYIGIVRNSNLEFLKLETLD